MRALSVAVRAAIVAACLGCLLAGCEPPGDRRDRPVGTYEIHVTPGPDGTPVLTTEG